MNSPNLAMSEAERAAIIAACTELMLRYAWTIDHRDFDGYCALFCEEMSLKMPGQPATTSRAALRKGLEFRPKDLTSRHVITNPLVEVIDDKTARGACYLSLYRLNGAPDANGLLPLKQPAAIGEYHDTYAKTAEGWRFKTRELRMIFRAETNQSA